MFYDLIVVGGGAAGFFSAITCAEHSDKSVLILEKTKQVLQKVKISGGGRCNVTHACFDPRELSTNYPRGSKSLIGPFNRFGPTETIEWFEGRGVKLKTEDDGRMFPITNDSQTIIDALTDAARSAGVIVRAEEGVNSISKDGDAFSLATDSGREYSCTNLLLATGGTRSASGARLASELGHTLQPATPSLFTFKIEHPLLDGLAGLSVDDAAVEIDGSKLSSTGPVLVTHWGLSGPGILKISAWGARELAQANYRFDVLVNWLPGSDPANTFAEHRSREPKKQLASRCPFPEIPKRLWLRFLEIDGVADNTTWAQLPKAAANQLAQSLTASKFHVDGKSMNKAEFVTCGGVERDDIDFRSMESKHVSGLFFAGEIIDIDGITGGFNFQNAWTSGFHAGLAIADS